MRSSSYMTEFWSNSSHSCSSLYSLKMEIQDGAELCFPQLFNTSCKKPAPPWTEVVLLHILPSFISVLTVTLNLLVIISVSHFRQISTYFIILYNLMISQPLYSQA